MTGARGPAGALAILALLAGGGGVDGGSAGGDGTAALVDDLENVQGVARADAEILFRDEDVEGLDVNVVLTDTIERAAVVEVIEIVSVFDGDHPLDTAPSLEMVAENDDRHVARPDLTGIVSAEEVADLYVALRQRLPELGWSIAGSDVVIDKTGMDVDAITSTARQIADDPVLHDHLGWDLATDEDLPDSALEGFLSTEGTLSTALVDTWRRLATAAAGSTRMTSILLTETPGDVWIKAGITQPDDLPPERMTPVRRGERVAAITRPLMSIACGFSSVAFQVEYRSSGSGDWGFDQLFTAERDDDGDDTDVDEERRGWEPWGEALFDRVCGR